MFNTSNSKNTSPILPSSPKEPLIDPISLLTKEEEKVVIDNLMKALGKKK